MASPFLRNSHMASTPASTNAKVPVWLRVYDISRGKAAMWSQLLLGKKIDGIWHTGIHVFDLEYFYGGGLDCMRPEEVESVYDMDIAEAQLLGYTTKSKREFDRFVTSINNFFTPETYDLLKWNCNHFSDTCARFLLEGHGIPEHILFLPETIKSTFIGDLILRFMRRFQTTGGNPILFLGDQKNKDMGAGGISISTNIDDPRHPRHLLGHYSSEDPHSGVREKKLDVPRMNKTSSELVDPPPKRSAGHQDAIGRRATPSKHSQIQHRKASLHSMPEWFSNHKGSRHCNISSGELSVPVGFRKNLSFNSSVSDCSLLSAPVSLPGRATSRVSSNSLRGRSGNRSCFSGSDLSQGTCCTRRSNSDVNDGSFVNEGGVSSHICPISYHGSSSFPNNTQVAVVNPWFGGGGGGGSGSRGGERRLPNYATPQLRSDHPVKPSSAGINLAAPSIPPLPPWAHTKSRNPPSRISHLSSTSVNRPPPSTGIQWVPSTPTADAQSAGLKSATTTVYPDSDATSAYSCARSASDSDALSEESELKNTTDSAGVQFMNGLKRLLNGGKRKTNSRGVGNAFNEPNEFAVRENADFRRNTTAGCDANSSIRHTNCNHSRSHYTGANHYTQRFFHTDEKSLANQITPTAAGVRILEPRIRRYH